MVACGLAHELDLQPRSADRGEGQLVRADGAQGYRCRVVSGRGVGCCLDFWRLPSGVTEFDSFTAAIRLVRPANNPDAA